MPTRRGFLTMFGAAGAGALAGCSAGYTFGDGGTESATTNRGTTVKSSPDRATDSPYANVYREVSGSVAQVQVATPDGPAGGSAAVIDDRRLVTNQHVVADASDVSVAYLGGEYTTAEVVGTDVYSDLAVLDVNRHPGDPDLLQFATEDPAIGTEVVVIGSPFGLEGSISEGIVSGVDRSLPGPNDFPIPDTIQTDAAANPGNSGGPLVALDGTPLGLVNSGTGNDITFAISGALMSRIIPALIKRGEYDHTYMGVAIRGVSPALAEANDLQDLRGVYVHRVIEDGPAEGVLQGSDGSTSALGQRVPTGGDVVVELDGEPTPTNGALGTYLALQKSPGDRLAVTVLRDGTRETLQMELGTRPDRR